ncbi:hypothetical protein G6O67_001119 [Ophiocordyceps sinensis]|uniref:Membrane anchor Opy2 N-terminal domain-containing protein n=1 Tax=Ophiocordyceps sinensis TaxID=72228 RepID=A0A8H4PWZ4_9HYPO|nr:hypothetical protein G6O67_001119 [Ophiocordyceps sinensis]
MEGETTSFATARDLKTLRRALQNVPQRRQCAQCGDTSKLVCPKCPSGQVCQYTVPSDCTQCAQTVCMVDESPQPPSNDGGDGNGKGGNTLSAAPIAGGVIGGIILVASLTYLVWRFLIKPKRSRMSQSIYDSSSKNARDVEKDNASRFTHRSSTHTVHSIASTVLTRASNIIQIAYIPGVTNRATPTSPSVLVPPVPPIPMHHTEGNRGSNPSEQHFFVPGNLRDSTYSGISEFSDRTSYAHRSSIASTIYGRQAQVQTPAQTGMRAKPTVVSVKPGGSGSCTPPVPSIDFENFGGGRPKSVTSTFSVGSTVVNNADTATQARALVVKLGGGGPRKIDVGVKPEANLSSLSLGSTASLDSPVQSGAQTPEAATAGDLVAGDQGPFSDPPPSTPKPAAVARTLGAVMEDEDEEPRDEGRRSRGPGSGERGRSPFGDEHATK